MPKKPHCKDIGSTKMFACQALQHSKITFAEGGRLKNGRHRFLQPRVSLPIAAPCRSLNRIRIQNWTVTSPTGRSVANIPDHFSSSRSTKAKEKKNMTANDMLKYLQKKNEKEINQVTELLQIFISVQIYMDLRVLVSFNLGVAAFGRRNIKRQ
ncbi:hypothetical protein MA16_Dca009584 [Dendrobium catenatum]|uniref:Uncharacterized protein n=1 Tax=Dendrobium catenatum TaxID=906689 RepID=A0A2I0VS20_9ASPA|nr:hypothetical protein MA16_Dca009584 [Dendrobium catenatum]